MRDSAPEAVHAGRDYRSSPRGKVHIAIEHHCARTEKYAERRTFWASHSWHIHLSARPAEGVPGGSLETVGINKPRITPVHIGQWVGDPQSGASSN